MGKPIKNKDKKQDEEISKLKTKMLEMKTKMVETRKKVDDYASEHPYKIAGYVAGASAIAGLLIGYLVGKK